MAAQHSNIAACTNLAYRELLQSLMHVYLNLYTADRSGTFYHAIADDTRERPAVLPHMIVTLLRPALHVLIAVLVS